MRALRTWIVTCVLMVILGPPAGLLWHAVSPHVRYVVVGGAPYPADPEGPGPIGTDMRFALITAGAGLLCGAVAYVLGGRRNDVALLLGLAAGGAAAAYLAWRTGHHIGLDSYRRAVRHAPDGRVVTGVPDLRATGILTFWPIVAVALYGVLELFVKRLVPRDAGEPGAGEPDEVVRGELDLQSAPARRDVDGREP
ncbi:hypothetical protein [Actinomadura atramentaria]|uniref:hypothetical protein n=1 Tax=Actinomadura atramentaria TaxID=1990 RepID=UPI001F0B3B6E|nr:hypothetical protein [Actinomadura atramentaria]